MTTTTRHDAWQAGDSYDRYMGRWSRRIAPRFLDWLDAPRGADWLDVGCGTGALTAAILEHCEPRSTLSIDPSLDFLSKARASLPSALAEFRAGDAQDLQVGTSSKDVVVSGLVLNFVQDRGKALGEMRRVARDDAIVGIYVWDYPGGGVQFLHAFWQTAIDLDPHASDLAEDRRFPFCTREGLDALCQDAGLHRVETTAIEAQSVFQDFDDFWRPFTLGAGPAPGYCASLSPAARERLRARLSETLPRQDDGSFNFGLRAWAAKARAA